MKLIVLSCLLLLYVGCVSTSMVKHSSQYEKAVSDFNSKIGSLTYGNALLAYGPTSNSTFYYDSTIMKSIRTSIWNFGGSGQVSTTVIPFNGIVYASSNSYQDRLLKLGFINDTLRMFDLSGMSFNTEPLFVPDTTHKIESKEPSVKDISWTTFGVLSGSILIGLILLINSTTH